MNTMTRYLCVLVAGWGSLTAGQTAAAEDAGRPANRLVIRADQGKHKIHRDLYGHFSEHLGRCVYEGFWVGEDSPIPNTRGIRNDVVAALRQIRIPVLRWPGGCFADEYHWRDGIGPRSQRPSMVNTHWGKVVENNHFGTHEFLDLCQQLGCEPYICGNVGSGTVQEMQQWVEYMTFDGSSPLTVLRQQNGRPEPWKLTYFGVGNENWGCGGRMTAEFYVDQFRRYATYVRNLGESRIFKIACGPNSDNYHWTEVLMSRAGPQMAGLALHYYTRPPVRSTAADFDERGWFGLLRNGWRMEELVAQHAALMDKYDPRKRVALIVDEWGTWHAVEPGTNPGFLYQQNTLRDAMVAAVTLNIFQQHCDRVRMANIAQTVNVLQAMILTDGARMIVTPTYHVFDLYKVHQDATLLPAELHCAEYRLGEEGLPGLSACASRDAAGKIHVSLCNVNPRQPAEIVCQLQGRQARRASGRVLTAATMQAHNTFERPQAIAPAEFRGVKLAGGQLSAALPAMSIVVLEIE